MNPLARRAKQVADEALMRATHAGGIVGGITALTGDVLAGPGAGSQVATIQGGLQNVVYVTPSGNDATGTGTLYKPFASISRALTSITTATPSNQFVIFIGPGTYTENVALKPAVFLVGIDPNDSITVNGNMTLDASWAASSGSGADGGASNLFVGTGAGIFDFSTVANTDGSVIFYDVVFENSVTATGFGSNSIVLFDTDASSVAIIGITLLSEISSFSPGGLSIAATSTLPASWASITDAVSTSVAVTGTAQAATAVLSGTSVVGTLTLTGTTAGYTTTADGVPAVVTLAGGAPPPVLTTLASGSNYTPAVPGNWVSPAPTTVQRALDRLAANTTNAHPIP